MTADQPKSAMTGDGAAVYPAAGLRPVFIYSGFRTSSSWFWNKFRNNPLACAYYEPFNNILADLKGDSILAVRPNSWRSHHPFQAGYLAEYGSMLGEMPGVPFFPSGDQDSDRFVGSLGVERALDPDIEAYVANLVKSAQNRGRIPVLACPRMLGRVAGLRNSFAGYHILLIRNLFQQWNSFSGQARFGNGGFLQILLKTTKISQNDKYISYLSNFFEIEERSDFDKWMSKSNSDKVFCYFVGFHLYFLMMARRHVDLVVDVNQLVRRGAVYQSEVSRLIAAQTRLQIDLGDARESVDYPLYPLASVEDCQALVRTMADRLLLSEARDDQDQRFVEDLIADLWEEHARFTTATAGAAEVIAGEIVRAQDEARRRAAAEALHAQALATLAELQNDSAAKIEAMKATAEKVLAEAQSAAAEASSLLEATSQQVASLERQLGEQVQARAADNAAAQAAAAQAASRLETAMREQARLERHGAEQARSHALALDAVNDRIAATESALADANARLIALQQDQLGLARENGRLEGLLGAQVDANAARLADAAAVRRHLASRLTRAERAVAMVQAEAASSLNKLVLQAREHEAALVVANARLAEQAADLVGQRDILAAELERTRQREADQSNALQSEILRLNDRIAWREQQLQQAASLLAAIPDPLAGLPRLLSALVRRMVSKTQVSAIADLQAAAANWQSIEMLPTAPEMSQGEILSLVGNPGFADAAFMHGGFGMLESDGPITSVPRLLAPHDRQFIHLAYQALLGRSPDPEGEAYYLARLRAGVHKLTILKQLRQSDEGLAFIPGVAGLDRAIRRHGWATMPFVGAVVRLFTGSEGNSATHRQLRILANELGCLHREQAALAGEIRRLGARITVQQEQPHAPDLPGDDAPHSPEQTPLQSPMSREKWGLKMANRGGLAGFFQAQIWNR